MSLIDNPTCPLCGRAAKWRHFESAPEKPMEVRTQQLGGRGAIAWTGPGDGRPLNTEELQWLRAALEAALERVNEALDDEAVGT